MEEATALAMNQPLPEDIEKVVISGDLTSLTPEQRVKYYNARCRSLGLNPLTEPFAYIRLNNKLTLYTRKDATEQLRKLHGVSLEVKDKRFEHELFIVHVLARDREGRTDEDLGFAPIGNLKGDALGNAMLKAVTKAKRRATLSICGLGDIDESEVDSIPGAVVGDSALEYQTPPTTASPYYMSPTADQISSLVELSHACGVSLVDFGDQVRKHMSWGAEVKINKKYLREHLHMNDFQVLWDHYQDLLKQQVEEATDPGDAVEVASVEAQISTDDDGEDVPEFDAPAAEVTPDSSQTLEALAHETSSGVYASATQLVKLKMLAASIGNDAKADLDDELSRYPRGLSLSVYDIMLKRLQERQVQQKSATVTS